MESAEDRPFHHFSFFIDKPQGQGGAAGVFRASAMVRVGSLMLALALTLLGAASGVSGRWISGLRFREISDSPRVHAWSLPCFPIDMPCTLVLSLDRASPNWVGSHRLR